MNRTYNYWKHNLGYWYKYMNIKDRKDIYYIMRYIKENESLIIPETKNIFKMFQLLSPQNVNVVMLGQEPYKYIIDKKPVASGIAFASNIKGYVPVQLKNIYDEIIHSYGFNYHHNQVFNDHSLLCWVKQGVFMLNTTLTTEADYKITHNSIIIDNMLYNWNYITTQLLKILSYRKNLIYVLFGNRNQQFVHHISDKSNLIINVSHPSNKTYKRGKNPLYGSNFAKEINNYLFTNNKSIIKWAN
jgi:uracil-DNA glycosylase